MRVTVYSNKSVEEGNEFYRSAEWKELRKSFIEGKELRCVCCGVEVINAPKKLNTTEFKGKEILNVDHILPVRMHWDKRLDICNLQILCNPCNKIKGNDFGPRVLEDVKSQRKLQLLEEKILADKDQNLYTWMAENYESVKIIEKSMEFKYKMKSDMVSFITLEQYQANEVKHLAILYFNNRLEYDRLFLKHKNVVNNQPKKKRIDNTPKTVKVAEPVKKLKPIYYPKDYVAPTNNVPIVHKKPKRTIVKDG